MKKHTTLAAALAAFALAIGAAAGLGSPSYAAAGQTDIKPGLLERGDNGYVPHVDGSDLVVADDHYAFPGREVRFLGYAGDQLQDYVVGTYRSGRPASHRVVVVTPGDERRVVLEGVSVPEILLSSDGDQLYRSSYRFKKKDTVLRVWSTEDGSLTNRRTFKGYVDMADAFAGDAVLRGSTPERTFWWDTSNGDTSRITGRYTYRADIRSNRLATLDGDPYDGGCSVVSTLTEPGETLWRSCDQAVSSFSPSGDRVVTTYLLADGLGPGEYQLRTIGGKRLHTFDTYYFGEALWEADEVLLMLAHGKTKSSWVRCDETGACERASRLRDTQH